MKVVLRTGRILSGTDLDGIANPILKGEREKFSKMFVELIRIVMNTGLCRREWGKYKNNFIVQRCE
jgi:hypothetical protein